MITFFRALATLSLTKNEKFKTIFDKPFFDIGQVLPQSQDYWKASFPEPSGNKTRYFFWNRRRGFQHGSRGEAEVRQGQTGQGILFKYI